MMGNLLKVTSGGYSKAPNKIMKRSDLSGKAGGYFCKIISLPNDWNFNVRGFTTLFTDGRDAVISGLQELENKGLLLRAQRRSEGGTFGNQIWVASDDPSNLPELRAILEAQDVYFISDFPQDVSGVPVDRMEIEGSIDGLDFSEYNSQDYPTDALCNEDSDDDNNDSFAPKHAIIKPQVATADGKSDNGSDQAIVENFSDVENDEENDTPTPANLKPQVATADGKSVNGSDQAIVENILQEENESEKSDENDTENELMALLVTSDNAASPQVATADGFSGYGKSDTILNINNNNIIQPISTTLQEDEPETSSLVENSTEKQLSTTPLDGNLEEKKIENEFIALSESAINRNLLTKTYDIEATHKAWTELIALGFSASEIQAAWDERQAEAKRLGRQPQFYPQLKAWLESSHEGGAEAMISALRARNESKRRSELSRKITELAQRDETFKNLLLSADAAQKTLEFDPSEENKLALKDAQAAIRSYMNTRKD